MALNTLSVKGKKKKAVKKKVAPTPVLIGEFSDYTSVSSIKDAVKKAGAKQATAYIECELDYSGCYYEGDIPSIKLKVYATK